jgi:hypothetical protein
MLDMHASAAIMYYALILLGELELLITHYAQLRTAVRATYAPRTAHRLPGARWYAQSHQHPSDPSAAWAWAGLPLDT